MYSKSSAGEELCRKNNIDQLIDPDPAVEWETEFLPIFGKDPLGLVELYYVYRKSSLGR